MLLLPLAYIELCIDRSVAAFADDDNELQRDTCCRTVRLAGVHLLQEWRSQGETKTTSEIALWKITNSRLDL